MIKHGAEEWALKPLADSISTLQAFVPPSALSSLASTLSKHRARHDIGIHANIQTTLLPILFVIASLLLLHTCDPPPCTGRSTIVIDFHPTRPAHPPTMSLSSTSSASSASSMSSINEKIDMDLLPPKTLLVRDFGWPESSARYHGDHTQESNPGWEHDPLDCPKAKEGAFHKMEVSYALYMANLGPPKQKKRATWTRFLPWVR